MCTRGWTAAAGVLSVTQYGRAEGVPGTDGTDGNQPLSWLAKDGRLWFATVDGVVIFDPTEIADTPSAPAVSIDTVQVNKQAVPLSALARTAVGPQHRHRLQRAPVDGWTRGAVRVPPARTRRRLGRCRRRRGPPRSRTCHQAITTSRCGHARAAGRRAGHDPRAAASTVPARFYETRWFLAASHRGARPLGRRAWSGGGSAACTAHQQELQRLVDERTAALRHEMLERERAERERRLLDERIQQAQRLESLGVLAGGVAHDFNNLLVGVLGEASLALADLPAGSAGRQHVERIERAALRASELTSQMLAYSGRGRFIVLPVQLEHLVEEVRELLGSIIPRAITVDPRLPAATCRWWPATRRSCARW